MQQLKNIRQLLGKKERKYNHIELLAKSKLIGIDVLISQALIHSYINHDELVTVNNALREYNEMKAEIKKIPKLLQNILHKYG